MRNTIMRRGLLGAPTGLTVLIAIILLMSHLRGDGELRIGYYLIRVYGNEVNAFTAACAGGMIIGMIWSAASVIYETDWNLLVQTSVHAVCCVAPSLSVAWILYWIPRTVDGIFQYAAIFAFIYGIVWLVQYLDRKKRVKQMNLGLKALDTNI